MPLNARPGFHSTVTRVETFNPNGFDQTNLSATKCLPTQVGVDTVTLTNVFGCDSSAITTTALLPAPNITVNATTCNPAAVGTFAQVLTAANGCDSTVTRVVNGTARGKQVSPGVFVFSAVVRLSSGTTRTISGDITVIR